MQYYRDVVLDQFGQPIEGLEVRILTAIGGPAVIFSATGQSISPVILTDHDGEFGFRATNGGYVLRLFHPAFNDGQPKLVEVRLFDLRDVNWGNVLSGGEIDGGGGEADLPILDPATGKVVIERLPFRVIVASSSQEVLDTPAREKDLAFTPDGRKYVYSNGQWVDISNFIHAHVRADIIDFLHAHARVDITDFMHTHHQEEIVDLAAQTYHHIQMNPSAIWTIGHGMGKLPSVIVFDSTGDKHVVLGDIRFLNLDTVEVTFASPFAGEAYLN